MRLSLPLLRTARHHNAWFMDGGLYGGAMIRFGKRVSEHGNRSSRKFAPNMLWSSLYSHTLQRLVRVRLTARVLKTVDAMGGLDGYILGQRQLESLKAEALKKALVLRAWRQELAERGIDCRYELADRGKRI